MSCASCLLSDLKEVVAPIVKSIYEDIKFLYRLIFATILLIVTHRKACAAVLAAYAAIHVVVWTVVTVTNCFRHVLLLQGLTTVEYALADLVILLTIAMVFAVSCVVRMACLWAFYNKEYLLSPLEEKLMAIHEWLYRESTFIFSLPPFVIDGANHYL